MSETKKQTNKQPVNSTILESDEHESAVELRLAENPGCALPVNP
jgi:hypothetical protein